MDGRRFEFRFAPSYRWPARVFGVSDRTTEVVVADGTMHARFGRWSLTSSLANIDAVEITGPYGFLKTAGPAHLSLADRGITFATNGDRGVCMSFREPVAAIEPTGRIKHPNLTVTVADCDGLVHALGPSSPRWVPAAEST